MAAAHPASDFLADYLAEPVTCRTRTPRRSGAPPGDGPGRRPTCRCSTRRPSCSATTTAPSGPPPRRTAPGAGRVRAGRAGPVPRARETYEFEDGREDSEVLAAHDIIDAERMAERQEEADHRSAAERAAADRTWAFGHIIVDEAQELSADGLAAADAPLPDPLA